MTRRFFQIAHAVELALDQFDFARLRSRLRRARELQHRGAAADAADQHHHGHKADQHIAADRTTGSERRLICHDDVLSLSDTTFICAGIGEVGRILRNTSSFGPTICTLPSRITST